jgi:hypothetical protein
MGISPGLVDVAEDGGGGGETAFVIGISPAKADIVTARTNAAVIVSRCSCFMVRLLKVELRCKERRTP